MVSKSLSSIPSGPLRNLLINNARRMRLKRAEAVLAHHSLLKR